MDKFRWRVFELHHVLGGKIPEPPQQIWDNYRLTIQGLVPPSKRTNQDFDPGAKFHIAHNTPYIRYFFAYILQFQFYERLCTAGKTRQH